MGKGGFGRITPCEFWETRGCRKGAGRLRNTAAQPRQRSECLPHSVCHGSPNEVTYPRPTVPSSGTTIDLATVLLTPARPVPGHPMASTRHPCEQGPAGVARSGRPWGISGHRQADSRRLVEGPESGPTPPRGGGTVAVLYSRLLETFSARRCRQLASEDDRDEVEADSPWTGPLALTPASSSVAERSPGWVTAGTELPCQHDLWRDRTPAWSRDQSSVEGTL